LAEGGQAITLLGVLILLKASVKRAKPQPSVPNGFAISDRTRKELAEPKFIADEPAQHGDTLPALL
jgi:hypothetical protein